MTSQQILDRLEELLAAAIPPCVKAIGITDPVYCLRIWYFGTDVPPEDRTPSLMLPKETWRQRMSAEKGDDAPYYIWCADEMEAFRDMAFFGEIGDPAITALVCDWYRQMPDQERSNGNELIPLQEMVRRVAARLNLLDWSEYAAVTDDFVVMAADGSHSFGDDYAEMVASVPSERIELFRCQQLLGRDSWSTLERLQ